jgi:hypothetical protein
VPPETQQGVKQGIPVPTPAPGPVDQPTPSPTPVASPSPGPGSDVNDGAWHQKIWVTKDADFVYGKGVPEVQVFLKGVEFSGKVKEATHPELFKAFLNGKSLKDACIANQNRVIELVSRAKDPEVTSELEALHFAFFQNWLTVTFNWRPFEDTDEIRSRLSELTGVPAGEIRFQENRIRLFLESKNPSALDQVGWTDPDWLSDRNLGVATALAFGREKKEETIPIWYACHLAASPIEVSSETLPPLFLRFSNIGSIDLQLK